MEPLDPALLMRAYAMGVFPMADDRDAPEIYWVEPKRRAILPLDGFRLSRSLARTLKREQFVTTADQAFDAVLLACAEATDNRPSTWINAQIARAVRHLHREGHAHSIEVWQDGALVGGLYGVRLGRAFFGESMFSRKTDASKVALAHLVARLRAGRFTLLDCQFQTPHLQSLGAVEVSKKVYSVLLAAAASSSSGDDGASADFAAFGGADDPPPLSSPRATMVLGPISGWRIVQSLTQTS